MIELKQMNGAELKKWRVANMISVKGCALLFKCRSIQQYYGWESGKIIIPLYISAIIPTITSADIQKVITEKDKVKVKKKITMTRDELRERIEYFYLRGLCAGAPNPYWDAADNILKTEQNHERNGGYVDMPLIPQAWENMRNVRAKIVGKKYINADGDIVGGGAPAGYAGAEEEPAPLPEVVIPAAPKYSPAHENRLRDLRIALDSLSVTHEEFYLLHESVESLSDDDLVKWEGIVSDRQQFGEF